MLLEKYKIPERNKHFQPIWMAKLECDKCGSRFEENWKNTVDKQHKRKEHLCKPCLNCLMSELSSKRLTNTRMKQSPEERKRMASAAGKRSQATGAPSKTWFTTKRWESMTEEDQRNQVTKANAAFITKLKSMTSEELADHYSKVQKGGIGFVSKGQQELEDSLKCWGFEGNQQIGSMNVDVCHHGKKIVVEYNGDAYHCNPKQWKREQYSTLIKMTAGTKWRSDMARYAILRKQGYQLVVIWESDWKSRKEYCLNRVKNIYEIRTSTGDRS